jgi:hypothetical protein
MLAAAGIVGIGTGVAGFDEPAQAAVSGRLVATHSAAQARGWNAPQCFTAETPLETGAFLPTRSFKRLSRLSKPSGGGKTQKSRSKSLQGGSLRQLYDKTC